MSVNKQTDQRGVRKLNIKKYRKLMHSCMGVANTCGNKNVWK